MNKPLQAIVENQSSQHPRSSSGLEDPELIPSIFAKSSNIENEASHRSDTTSVTAKQGKARLIDRFFRRKYIELFKCLEGGHITLIDPLGSTTLGEPNANLHCTLTILDLRSYTKVALGGSNGSAQAYIDGLWSIDNLSHLIRIFVSNRVILERLESGVANSVRMLLLNWQNMLKRNTRSGSKRNIAAHYDLGNDFFRLFLDQRMMYSSALYEAGDNLESASERKLSRICNTLELSTDDHVIEIGSGWGGFACFAAATTGCRVTTVTISQEQFIAATALVKQQGLQQQVVVKLQDYRDIEGTYDKLVSIEMIEAIGHQYQNTYFRKLNHLLKPNGKALIQAIVIDDSQYHQALKEVDYIKRYIFPGGFMPCYSVISQVAAQNRLMLEDLHDMGLSYAKTLRDWRKRFYQQIETVSEQGYDTAFQRMWEFYLCYCEGAFDERAISVGQILLRKQSELN